MEKDIKEIERENRVSERKARRKKEGFVLVLVLLLAGITIGFSTLSTNLNINGTSKIKNNTWDVEIPDDADVIECPASENCIINPQNDTPPVDPDDLTPGEEVCDDPTDPTTCTTTGPVVWMDGDTVYFKHLLEKPTDTFTFDVRFENNGTIDAKIATNGVQINGFTSTAADFLDYEVVYKGTTTVPQAGDTLAAGDADEFTVTVTYKSSVDTLPTAAQLAAINGQDGDGAPTSFTVTYEQA